MITDKFKGYNSNGVKVTIYAHDADSYSMAVVTCNELGVHASIEPVGSNEQARFRLVICKYMRPVDTSYWTTGDVAIQVAIDSITS